MIFRLMALLLFLAGILPMAQAEENQPVAIVIHGGAGTILKSKMTPETEQAYRRELEAAVRAGHEVLMAGGSSREAIVAAIVLMEDSELFNAGKGAVFTQSGKVELDASIMDGKSLEAGAVTGIRRIKNPIVLANDVLEHSVHVMLMGEGAEEYAASRGFEFVDNSYFYTERRREQLRRVQQSDGETALSEDDDDARKLGTLGAVAIDRQGTIAAATSTGGMTNKRFGRIGDSPIIGAGTYADNGVCGISATGHGEYFIRAAVAHDICARAAYQDVTLQEAADQVIQKKLVDMGADGGIIGIDRFANIVFSFNSEGMYRAAIDREGKLQVRIFRE
ncbi:MAG: isoaspartyl peptidase/L-asparaginase [Pseudomonadales bacterium]|nr:isoaspartyl peptidase/L-asparaginase [Pseudomonadales bacterium]